MNLGNEFKEYAIKHMGISSLNFYHWEQLQEKLYGSSASLTPYILHVVKNRLKSGNEIYKNWFKINKNK